MTGKAKNCRKLLKEWRFGLTTWRAVIWKQPFYRN